MGLDLIQLAHLDSSDLIPVSLALSLASIQAKVLAFVISVLLRLIQYLGQYLVDQLYSLYHFLVLVAQSVVLVLSHQILQRKL